MCSTAMTEPPSVRMGRRLRELESQGVRFCEPGEAMRRAVEEAEECTRRCLLGKCGVRPYFRDERCEDGMLSGELLARVLGGTGAYVFGKPGTWKTRSACAAIMEAARECIEALFIDTAALMASHRRDEGCIPMRSICEVRILAIDDADKLPFENGFGKEAEALYNVLDARQGMPTIVTSNQMPSELCARIAAKAPTYAAAVKRRIDQQMGRPIVAEGGGRWRVLQG